MLMATPRNMAMPPKRGMVFLCIRLPSFGTSIAPTKGAILIATGVRRNDSIKAMKNDSINVL